MNLTVVIDSAYFSKYKSDFFEIYHESFPDKERQTDEEIESRILNNRYQLICSFSEENEMLGFACLLDIGYRQCKFVEYFAVKRSHRQRGVGTKIIQRILDICDLGQFKAVLEVENPKYGSSKEQKENRILFYKKNRFNLIKDFEYLLPPLDGISETEMLFMCTSLGRKRMRYDELILLTESIYKKVYSRGNDDISFQKIIEKNQNKRYYEVI